jgi:hypothetical protein
MLCEMMRAVVFPEAVDLVHEAVIPVEPEIKHDSVKTDLEGEDKPVD